jgi:membrane-associated phospholipid phosphatase
MDPIAMPVSASPEMIWFTNFGDLAVILPMAVVVGVWLSWAQGPRLGLIWAAIFTASVGSIWGLKILLAANPISLGKLTFHSPSGHAGVSATLYGMTAVIFAVSARRAPRIIGIISMVSMIVAVTVSRVVLSAHSSADAWAGAFLGLLWLIPIVFSLKEFRGGLNSYRSLAIGIALIATITHGLTLPIYRLDVVPIYRIDAAPRQAEAIPVSPGS